jgi:hypothetical protein
LMGHFYKSMLQDRLPPAAALRFAKEQMRKERDWASPFFWAGFVLQGEFSQFNLDVRSLNPPHSTLAIQEKF